MAGDKTLYELGVDAAQSGNIHRAVDLFTQAALIAPLDPFAQNNLALALMMAGQFARSLAIADRAIALKPDYFEAHSNRGLVMKSLGRNEEALRSYDRCLSINPDHAPALNNRGILLSEIGSLEEALACFDKALQLLPGWAEVHSERASVLRELRRFEESLRGFEKAAELNPSEHHVHVNRGALLHRAGRLEDALDSLDRAISLNPNIAEAHNNRGVVLRDLNRWQEAVDSFNRALTINPGHADAWSNRGIALFDLGDLDSALASVDRALFLRADFAEAHANRGLTLHRLGRVEEALHNLNHSLRLQPHSAETYNTRGLALQDMRQIPESLDSFNQAIRIQPDYASPHFNAALCRLLTGDFDKGWEDYEWRWKEKRHQSVLRSFKQPLWLGSPSLDGKTILIYSEQGLGDTLQFTRYIHLVEKLAASVVFEVQPELLSLLASQSYKSTHVIAKGAPLPDFDYQCPLLSLPLAFRTDAESIPDQRPYLEAETARIQWWRERLGPKSKPRVGWVWKGNPLHQHDRRRSIGLQQILTANHDGVETISLQKEISDSESVLLASSDIRHVGSEIRDFADTAALVDQMDLIVSVDTSVAHLAGAMAKATWVMLPSVPDWRWMLDREDSPWYPTIRLFRQPKWGDWDSVMEQVRRALVAAYANTA